VLCAFPDPDTAGKTIYAALVGSSYGIYRGTSFNVATSQVLAAPIYDSVQTLQPAPNGAVLVVATVGMTSNAYLLSGGTSRLIDQADAASISADGTKVVYTKTVSDVSHLYVWDRASSSVQTIAASLNAVLPSFSRDGAWVLFSSDTGNTSDTPWDLYQVPTAGGTIERLTNTPAVNELGACYDPSRTMISYFGQALTTSLSGIYVRSNGGAQRIATDTDVNFATYWTSSDGRSFGLLKGGRFQTIGVRRSKRR
jgi:Tol biopolymer transport system component